MFDHLQGQLVRTEPTRLVVRVGGVGYQCQVPLGTGERLERCDGGVLVYVLTVSQEDLPRLLGFASTEERDLCRLILKVGGIGPALALSLLSADSPRQLLRAIETEDVAWLKRIKGIGAKTAQRICLEIKDRATTWLTTLGAESEPKTPRDPVQDDAIQALVSLGFSAAEAEKRVDSARKKDADAATEELVKTALRG